MKYTIKELEEQSKHRPQGYYNEVLSLSKKIDNDKYELSDENFKILAEKYRLPSLFRMTSGLFQAAVNHIKDPTKRTEEQIKDILKICAACPYLIENEFRCSKCGCPILRKVSLDKNTHCPINKW